MKICWSTTPSSEELLELIPAGLDGLPYLPVIIKPLSPVSHLEWVFLCVGDSHHVKGHLFCSFHFSHNHKGCYSSIKRNNSWRRTARDWWWEGKGRGSQGKQRLHCSQRLSWMRNGWLWLGRIIADRAVCDTLWWITVVMCRSCLKVASLSTEYCRTWWLLAAPTFLSFPGRN